MKTSEDSRSENLRSFSFLTLITVGTKLITFIYEAVIAAKMGANISTDAYFSATEIFSVIDDTLLTSFTIAALGRFSLHMEEDGKDSAYAAISNIFSVYLPVIAVISLLIFTAAKPLSYVAAPGFNSAQRVLTIRSIREMAAVPLIMCGVSIYSAVLRYNKSYALVNMKGIFIGIIGAAAVLILGSETAIQADVLSVSFVCSIIAYCAAMKLRVRSFGKVSLCRPVINEDIKTTLKMAVPLMISFGVSSGVLLIDKMIASTLGSGNVSALTYSHTLYRVVENIFITNLAMILLTDFNDYAVKKDSEKLKEKIQSAACVMTAVLIPVTITAVLCRIDIVKIIYQRGEFTAQATEQVGNVLMFYALNFIPALLQAIYNHAMYSVGDTKTPMRISLMCIAVNICVSLPLTKVLGLPGVAIGTVVSTLLAAAAENIKMKRYIENYKGCYTVSFVINSIIAAVPAALAARAAGACSHSSLLSFVFTAAAAFTVYFALMYILKDQTVRELIKMCGKARG